MNATTTHKDARRPMAACLVVSALLLGTGAHAQVPVDDDGNPIGTMTGPGADVENPLVSNADGLSDAELAELVGPVALYPDDLLAIVLPASTYPLDVVQAARYLEQVKLDPSLEPDENWDDSVVALLNYPEVLELMNEDIDWTWALGEAVVSQQADVILAIESFRDRAYAAGNLATDDRQSVTRNDEGIIEIEPVSEDVIYVPYYEPERVVYYSPSPVYYYYPRAYPVYYYPYPRHHYLTSGFFWGVTTAFTIGWLTDDIHVYHHSYYGHPYYGRYYGYYGSYWRRPSINIYNTWYVNDRSPYYRDRYHRGDRWRPRHRSGARPRTHVVDSGYYRNRDGRPTSSGPRYRHEGDYRDRGGRNYRDQRTDGTRFNAGTRNRGADGRRVADTAGDDARNRNLNRGNDGNRGRRAANAANPARGIANRDRRADTRRGGDKEAIRFRPRGDGSHAATRQPRIRTADNNARNRAPDATPDRRRADSASRATQRATPRLRAPARQSAAATPRNRDRAAAVNRTRAAARTGSPEPAARRAAPSRSTSGFAAPRQSRATPARQSAPRQSPPRQSRSAAPRQPRSSAPRQAREPAASRGRAASARSMRNGGVSGRNRSGDSRKKK